MNLSRIIVFSSFLFISVQSAAQRSSIRTSVDKNKILLGERFQFTIEAVYPLINIDVLKMDTIPHFELAAAPVIDSTVENQWVTIKKVYTLTSFDSGHWNLPAFVISKKVHSDSLPMDVVFSDFDTSQPYHPIKDILDVKVKKETPWWWYALGGGLLLLAALVYFLTRKKKKTPRVEAGIKDPYHTALQELESLSKNKPDTKTYYSRLTEILRLYLFRKKSLLSLHKTTDDLVIQMKDLSLSREELEKISQTLRLSDFVKFARYIPAAEDDETAFINIKKTIMAVENSSASPAS